VLRQWRDEQALRESEARYRDLFESAGDLIQGIAPDGTILFVNRAWREVLGYREEELRGLKLVDFVHPSSLSDSLDKFHRVLRGESIASMETTYVTKDGREVILEGSASCQFANGRPVSARAIFHEVTAKKHAEAELKAALKDKEVLLQEIHHRVKNNLQIVSSLLNLQANDYDDPTLRKAFAESQQRIRSMALIHEMLYESENLAEIDFGKYLRALVPTLMLGYSARSGGITHDIQADDIALRPQTAVPLALIVNELVTNSLSHAFSDGRSGRIAIECRRRDRGEIALMVRDNGLGLPQGFSMQNTRSLGLRLVGMMVNQLSAKLEARDEGGASFELVFTPMDETSAHR
jgi:PAS domain S-box-containing protein